MSTISIFKTSVCNSRKQRKKRKYVLRIVVKCCGYVSYLWQLVHAFCLLPIKKMLQPQGRLSLEQLQQMDPDLADVLYDVLCQDSKWITVSHNCVHIFRIRLKYGHSTLPLYPFPLDSFSVVAKHLHCTESAITAGCHSAALGLILLQLV